MTAARKQKIVLHISDDENDRYLIKRTIKSVHPSLMIRHLEHAEDAVEFLDQAKLFNDLPCLIIMSIGLTINGQEAHLEFRKDPLLSAIPIVVFLKAEDNDIKKGSRDKVIFTSKPATYKEFAKFIRKVLLR